MFFMNKNPDFQALTKSVNVNERSKLLVLLKTGPKCLYNIDELQLVSSAVPEEIVP